MTDNSPKVPDGETLVELIQRMNEDELRFFNRLIVDRLKLLDQARSTVMLSQFNVGDRVGFSDRDGVHRAGLITRLNKKTATVITDDQQLWNVSPYFLRPIRPADGNERSEQR